MTIFCPHYNHEEFCSEIKYPESEESRTIYCHCGKFKKLPELCSISSLCSINLYCSSNKLTKLPELPKFLVRLYCSYNHITELPYLPDTLQELSCQYNCLRKLPNLPEKLRRLECGYNAMKELPDLPKELEVLYCGCTLLTKLPELPNSLKELHCQSNRITELPSLPDMLEELYCYNCDLKYLPILPLFLECLCFPDSLLPPHQEFPKKYTFPSLLDIVLRDLKVQEADLQKLPIELRELLTTRKECPLCYKKSILHSLIRIEETKFGTLPIQRLRCCYCLFTPSVITL
jgi:Leucine-rich repeat (LRR) protein